MSSHSSTRAIVCHPPNTDGSLNWTMETLHPRAMKEDELVVRIVAAGLCHSDVMTSLSAAIGGFSDRVLGHEGAGIVIEAGPKVTTAKPGDAVLLSFASCKTCSQCSTHHPAYCSNFAMQNYVGGGDVFSACNSNGTSSPVKGSFFGQSSFSHITIVDESSVVNVSGLLEGNVEEELKLFAPLGCGLQTGAGTVVDFLKAGEEDTVVVLGLGAVGLSAVMGARIVGCKIIVGVDRVGGRLELARELGVTGTIDTSAGGDLGEEVRKLIPGGPSIVIDATANVDLIRQGWGLLGARGKLVVLGGVDFAAKLDIPLFDLMVTGKTLTATIEGDTTPSDFIPRMIKWYREGKFPIDKLVQYFPADDFDEALAGMKSGAIIKPVLVWADHHMLKL